MSRDAPRILVVDDNVEFAMLLGTLLAEQGFAPVLVHDAAEALDSLRREKPMAVALDMLLPDLAGHKLLERISPKLQDVPVFIMSGVFKGAAQRDKLACVHPVSGWFDKPFDTRVLVQAIAGAVGWSGPPKGRDAHQAVKRLTSRFDIQILVAVESGVANPPAPAQPHLHIDIDVDLSEDVFAAEEKTEFDVEASGGFSHDHTASAAEVAAGLRTNLRRGSLSDTTVPRLIYAFYVAQETGEVVFEQGDIRKVVYFDRGAPVYALSNQLEERLGEIAKRQLGLTQEQIDNALVEAKKGRQMIGDVLVDQGLVPEARRDRLLAAQTRSIILSLFSWTHGSYVVGFKLRTEFKVVNMDEHPGALVLNGVREQLDDARLQAILPDRIRATPSANPSFAFHELPLTDPEARVLLRVTGRQSVGELAAAGWADSKTTRGLLYALLTVGVLVTT